MKLILTFALAAATLATAQQAQDSAARCRQEAASRLNANRDDINTTVQNTDRNSSRISWTYRDRSGYCVIDSRLNLTEFREFTGDDRRYSERTTPIADVPKVDINTSGTGNYNSDEHVRITRGWVNTKQVPTVGLSGEHDFKITFFGNITRQNGPGEYVITIRGSNKGGNATGEATFRLNDSHEEVEFISLHGTLNGREFSGSFNR
jgi:hypothetical protein